ncbi:MAG TPA: hypothetical protein VGR35_10080 [Tepidisphaeraceae bacterium]|nr:hypothetical protein [Tepidisphaeraceae bacterium]
MRTITLDLLTEHLDLADQLRDGRDSMFEPEDLPGRYGRVVRAVNHLLAAIDAEAVLGGGWAVWRHGFLGRVTQDVDIVLPAHRVDEFLRVAGVSGFDVLPQPPGRWPKLLHRETNVQVDILPEGQRPGTESRPAPTVLPAPSAIGAAGTKLRYITLPALVELKLAAGRARDESDVVELVRANLDCVQDVRRHLGGVHADYLAHFERLVQRARQERDQ